ncbi:MAG: D-glycero-beta-D-manno-heptose-7-phosphate kinase [Bacteroidetes bacterium]|nr:MAG: D-glycero-beta-D-manno-heptose-7-phosphate kinase [Bacteroidota bacterium]TAG95104.1 MAG: D-glycero-beta-D-manno-heptose-7-phosphate kinase [Bacteroidota bacterium]
MNLDFDKVFEQFNHVVALVIGDVMIDSYLWGDVTRISPEAPVPIVNVKKREKRLGGAANVALNLKAMGANPILCAVVGDDADGQDFFQLLQENQLEKDGILVCKNRPTTIKHRILSGHQQMLRIDAETTENITDEEENLLYEKIKKLVLKCQVIIFEDYDKGVLSESLIQKVITFAKENNIPSVVDPKKRNFLHYQNTNVFKPNLKELKEGLKIDFDVKNNEALQKSVLLLKEKLNLEYVFVTLSERGVLLAKNKNDFFAQNAHIRQIADVSGAGDTVISIVALGVAIGLNPNFWAALANLAGGLVCEYVGVVSIDKTQLLAEAKEHIKF